MTKRDKKSNRKRASNQRPLKYKACAQQQSSYLGVIGVKGSSDLFFFEHSVDLAIQLLRYVVSLKREMK